MSFWLSELIRKNSYLHNYLKKAFFCQAHCFNFQSNQDSFLVNHVARLLAWHIKFEKRKTLKKKISEELMPIAWHSKRW